MVTVKPGIRRRCRSWGERNRDPWKFRHRYRPLVAGFSCRALPRATKPANHDPHFGYDPSMWRLAALLWIVLALAASAGERRGAPVVGASAYRTVPALRNTLNDANGIAAALKRLEFEVDTVPNPDRAVFEAAIRRFGNRARTADVALFFYAGHAVESGGHNWLLPVSA